MSSLFITPNVMLVLLLTICWIKVHRLTLSDLGGRGWNPPEQGTFLNISQTVQGTVKKFYKFIFTLFEIVLHVLKFSFVFICCYGNHFFQVVTDSRNEQSHLDSTILARLHSNLVRGWDILL